MLSQNADNPSDFLTNLAVASFGKNNFRKTIIQGLGPGVYRKLLNEFYTRLESNGIDMPKYLEQSKKKYINQIGLGNMTEDQLERGIDDVDVLGAMLTKSQETVDADELKWSPTPTSR